MKTSTFPFSKEKPKILPTLSESDKLNGNNELLEAEKAGQDASASPAAASAAPTSKPADGGPASPGVVLRKKPVCAAAKQPAARASMSSIIKGSVMDKVTTVFNNGVTMGNANNSANKKASELPTAPSGPELPISPVANVTTEAEKSGGGGINIPKGKLNKLSKCQSGHFPEIQIFYFILQEQLLMEGPSSSLHLRPVRKNHQGFLDPALGQIRRCYRSRLRKCPFRLSKT